MERFILGVLKMIGDVREIPLSLTHLVLIIGLLLILYRAVVKNQK